MLDNHVYNLLKQLEVEHKSLWRIKNHYLDEAGACAECNAFWKKMEKDKEEHVTELTALLKKHLA